MSTSSTADVGDAGPTQPHNPPAQQLNRSCESCRSLKVRCLPDPVAPDQCQRCAKARRPCVFVAPQRRRPRKRTDSRVAQLEREMRMMRSLLKDQVRDPDSSPEGAESERENSCEPDFSSDHLLSTISEAPPSSTQGLSPIYPPSSVPSTFERGTSLSAPSFTPAPTSNYSLDMPSSDDVVDRGMISLELADELVAIFIHELTEFFPAVVLSPDTTASHLRRSKPVLFLSVITAASMTVDASVAAILNSEMVRIYAERFFVQGDKSLELVQALILMTVFYYPPDSPLKLQHYQYIHIAATMALEIGLASKRKASSKSGGGKRENGVYDEHMAEQARAILGCYHLASTVAMKTRRPNLLLFNDWMNECVRHLEHSPNFIDRQIATWFDLQRIVDEAHVSFGLDDTSSTAPLTESRVQAVLRWFDNRMQSWKKNIPMDMLTVPMTLEYYYTNLAVYELGVGEGHRDPDAIKQKYYTLPTPDDGDNAPSSRTQISAIRIDLTVKWMNAAQELLDFFLTCDTDTMRNIPNLVYTRVGVAIMSLLKIYFSVKSGPLGEAIAPETVNVDMYLDAMTKKLKEASNGGKYKIPSRWYYVIATKGRDWYNRFQTLQAQRAASTTSPVKPSPPTPQNPIPMSIPYQTQLDPATQPQMGALGTGMGISRMPMGSMGDNDGEGYAAPAAMNPMWPSDNHHDYLTMDQFANYPPNTLPSQFVYETRTEAQPQPPQQHPTAGNQNPSHYFTSGMELDGWIPDGSIFGRHRLSE